VRVPGVTGAQVAAFSIARDGSRLAVARAGTPAPPVLVASVLRSADGVVSGAGRVRSIPTGVGDAARLVDIGWRDAGTLALLSRPTSETSRVSYLSADGSPASSALVEASVFRGSLTALVVAPENNLPLRVVTAGQRVYALNSNGQWAPGTSKVLAATYGQ
jgi:hypothetical protein